MVDEYVDPAQSAPSGCFVLRADAIRPYNLCRKPVPFNRQLKSESAHVR